MVYGSGGDGVFGSEGDDDTDGGVGDGDCS